MFYRFIPNRKVSDYEYGHYAVMKKDLEEDEADKVDNEDVEKSIAGNIDYQERLKDAMDVRDRKILAYSQKAPVSKS